VNAETTHARLVLVDDNPAVLRQIIQVLPAEFEVVDAFEDGDELLADILAALDRMTRFEVVVPVTGDVEKGKPYRARVRAKLDKVGLSEPLRSIVFFSSLWDVETAWARGDLQTP
jgi:CheY-like chemotaxis protein